MKKLLKNTRNKFEKRISLQLKRAKVLFKYESERIPYVLAGYYVPDFCIETISGKVYIETKGYFRPEAKRKMVAVKKQHPEKDIRIVFYSRSAANERWAIKHGFKYAFETIPRDWLNGL
jgi:predicted nuclease of restriction endonuclease-like RecB superfamily